MPFIPNSYNAHLRVHIMNRFLQFTSLTEKQLKLCKIVPDNFIDHSAISPLLLKRKAMPLIPNSYNAHLRVHIMNRFLRFTSLTEKQLKLCKIVPDNFIDHSAISPLSQKRKAMPLIPNSYNAHLRVHIMNRFLRFTSLTEKQLKLCKIVPDNFIDHSAISPLLLKRKAMPFIPNSYNAHLRVHIMNRFLRFTSLTENQLKLCIYRLRRINQIATMINLMLSILFKLNIRGQHTSPLA